MRKRAQAQLSSDIGHVSEMEQQYLSELLSYRGGAGSGAYAMLAGNVGATNGREENQRAAGDAFDNGPANKRYRGLNEVGRDESNVYRQQQQYGQHQPQQLGSIKIDTFESHTSGGLEYGQLAALDAERFGSAGATNDERQYFRGIGSQNQRQFEQQAAAPPGYDPGYTGTNGVAGNVIGGGGGDVRNSSLNNDLDIAEKYCRDLFLAEEEESQRRKAVIQAEMEKISVARSVGAVAPQQTTRMDEEHFQQRSATTDSRSWRMQQSSESLVFLRFFH